MYQQKIQVNVQFTFISVCGCRLVRYVGDVFPPRQLGVILSFIFSRVKHTEP